MLKYILPLFIAGTLFAQTYTVEIQHQLQRMYSAPPYTYEVFTNAADIAHYVTNSPTRAYPGQIVALVDGGTTSVFKISGTATNMSLGSVNDGIDWIAVLNKPFTELSELTTGLLTGINWAAYASTGTVAAIDTRLGTAEADILMLEGTTNAYASAMDQGGATTDSPTFVDVTTSGGASLTNAAALAATALQAESDTLQTVVNRGATSTNTVTLKGIQLDTTNTDLPTEGGIAFVDDQGGVILGVPGGGYITLGSEMQARAYNDTGGTLTNGTLVTFEGRQGAFPKIIKVSATNVSEKLVVGMVTTSGGIADGAFGQVTCAGLVRDVPNPQGYTDGEKLYMADIAGVFTNTPAAYPSEPYIIGKVAVALGGTMSIELSLDGWKTWDVLDGRYVVNSGDTVTGSILSTVDHLTSAPASDEFPTAGWVRSLAMQGAEWYFTDSVTNGFGEKTANFVALSDTVPVDLFTNAIASPVPSDTYLAGGVATQAFGSLRSPVSFEIHMNRVGGNASSLIPVYPEVYYIYNGTTNHIGDYGSVAQAQTISATTPTKYTFTVAFPEPAITGAVHLVAYLKSGTVSGTAAGLNIYGGDGLPSHLNIDSVAAGETAADVAADLLAHEGETEADDVHGLTTTLAGYVETNHTGDVSITGTVTADGYIQNTTNLLDEIVGNSADILTLNNATNSYVKTNDTRDVTVGSLTATGAVSAGTLSANSATVNTDYIATGTSARFYTSSTVFAARYIGSFSGGWTDGADSAFIQYARSSSGKVFITSENGGRLQRFGISSLGTVVSDSGYASMEIPTAVFHVVATVPSKTTVRIDGATSQTASYLEITEQGGTQGGVLKVDSAGDLILGGGVTAGGAMTGASVTATGVSQAAYFSATNYLCEADFKDDASQQFVSTGYTVVTNFAVNICHTGLYTATHSNVTVKAAGLYRMDLNLSFASGSAAELTMLVYTNGAAYTTPGGNHVGWNRSVTVNSDGTVAATKTLSLQANDVVDWRIISDGTDTLTWKHGTVRIERK